MNSYLCIDLHVHTALSPCAANEMTPQNIIAHAQKSGLNAIAITDHNSSGNVFACMQEGKKHGITVIPGMEVETKEEVHILTLFDNLTDIAKWEQLIQTSLPAVPNNTEIFGNQILFNADLNQISEYPILLTQSINMTLDKVVENVLNLGGIPIPSHIYRKANGIQSVLGFIPPALPINTIEVNRSTYMSRNIDRSVNSLYNILVNSDAHCIRDLYENPSTALKADQNSAKAIIKMLKIKLSNEEVVII